MFSGFFIMHNIISSQVAECMRISIILSSLISNTQSLCHFYISTNLYYSMDELNMLYFIGF